MSGAAGLQQSVGNYNVSSNGTVCLLFYVALDLTIKYNKMNETEPSSAKFAIPAANTEASGMCGEAESNVKLSFWDGYEFEAMFKQTNNMSQVTLDMLKVTYNASDSEHFPNSMDSGIMSKSSSVGLNLGGVNQFFLCNSMLQIELGNASVTVIMRETKLQVFNVMNDTFSNDMKECTQDMSTAPPTTTNTPTTAPTTNVPPTSPPEPQKSKFSLQNTEGNVTCLIFQAALQFAITYTKMDNTTATATINVPKEGMNGTMIDHARSSCDAAMETQIITLSFFRMSEDIFDNDGWSVKFTMSNNKTVSGDENKFVVNAVELDYILDHNFVMPKNPGAQGKATIDNQKLFMASVGNSYLCNSAQTVKLSDDVNMKTEELQIEPFRKEGGNSTAFATPEECSLDDNTSDLVPIIVGCALAALVIVVLIAYLIGRRRSTKGYQTV